MELNDFANALAELGKVQDGIISKNTKYEDISNLIQKTDNDIATIETNLTDNNEKTKLYKYLTYLFVGGLADTVNVATGNKKGCEKGLNLRLKDMHIEEFKQLLEQPAFGNIINETGVSGAIMKIDGKERIIHACTTPSNVLNNAYTKVMDLWKSDKDLDTKLIEFVNLYNKSKQQIKEVRHDTKQWYRCGAKRPFVNLWRMCKRAYQAQDFSYACDKYKNVFSLLDTSQKSNEMQK